MHPVLVEIGPITIRFYGLMYVIAFIVGFVLVRREIARKNIKLTSDGLVDLFLWTIPVAIVGARLYYVAFQWGYYSAHLGDIVKIWEGGLAIHGGVIAGAITVYVFCRAKRLSFWRLADALVPSLILGQAIGRIGNLMNGDAHGLETSLPWGIQFPETVPAGQKLVDGFWMPAGPTHPTMIYEMLLNLAVFVFLWWWVRKRGFRDGFSTAMYVILYSVGRSIVSLVRADSLWIGPVRAAHVVSAVLIVGFVALIVVRRLYRREPA